MPHLAAIEMSRNTVLKSPLRDQLAEAAPSKIRSRLLSVILPEYADVFAHGTVDTVFGVMERQTSVKGRLGAYKLPYGFESVPVKTIDTGEPTIAFTTVVSGEQDLFDDPVIAATNFHANLINDVNESLRQQQSPYRLATIALQAAPILVDA